MKDPLIFAIGWCSIIGNVGCGPSDPALKAVYSNQKFPTDFYDEHLTNFQNIYYENSISINSAPNRSGPWIELCTNDQAQALAWSEASNQNSSQQRPLEATLEAEKYFEFLRAPNFKSRVHRCSYIDRSQYDVKSTSTMIGVFNVRPITVENAKVVIEYLWFIKLYNAYGQNVLESFNDDEGALIHHTIRETRTTSGNSLTKPCDTVEVVRSEYLIDKSTGQIQISQTPERTVNCD